MEGEAEPPTDAVAWRRTTHEATPQLRIRANELPSKAHLHARGTIVSGRAGAQRCRGAAVAGRGRLQIAARPRARPLAAPVTLHGTARMRCFVHPDRRSAEELRTEPRVCAVSCIPLARGERACDALRGTATERTCRGAPIDGPPGLWSVTLGRCPARALARPARPCAAVRPRGPAGGRTSRSR
jgi:hypothetical protein